MNLEDNPDECAGGDLRHVANEGTRQSADERAGGDRAVAALKELYLTKNQLRSAGGDRAAHVAGEVVPQRQLADERAGGDLAAHVAGGVAPRRQSADERAGGDWAHIADGPR